MSEDRHQAPAARKTARRWHIMPPMTRGSAALEGLDVLEERSDALGLLLWRTARSVSLWTRTDPEERSDLGRPGVSWRRDELLREASLPRAISPAVRSLVGLMEKPGEESAEEVSARCRSVAEWAEAAGLAAAALAFAQGAALVVQEDPFYAYEVGRLAGVVGDRARSEVWLRRAVGLARHVGDWAVYARAHLDLAALHRARGELELARVAAHRARRTAERWSLHELQGAAFYDLFRSAMAAGQRERAAGFARQALSCYPREHPQVAVLAADLVSAVGGDAGNEGGRRAKD